MKPIIFILLSSLTLFYSCDDDDGGDQLPPETQTGANTFGFIVNGKTIEVRNTFYQLALYEDGVLQLGGTRNYKEGYEGVYMLLKHPIKENIEYSLIKSARFHKKEGDMRCYYSIEDAYKGSIVITKLDIDKRIVSGRFEFSTVKKGCENIDVTNGRFDLQF